MGMHIRRKTDRHNTCLKKAKAPSGRDTTVPRTEKKDVRSTESGVDPRQGTGRSDDGPADRCSAGCPAATTEEHGRREVSFTELSVGRVLRSARVEESVGCFPEGTGEG